MPEFLDVYLIAAQLIVPPGLFFLYGLNVVNSLLRKENESLRRDSRVRLLKRSVIFFLVAEMLEGTNALVNAPEKLLHHLLTWELFHLFSFTTLFLLMIFEIGWQLETRRCWNYKRVVLVSLTTALLFVLSIFLIFHDYSMKGFQGFSVELDITSILQRAVFEYGQVPIIPWLSFGIAGGLTAVYLDLPHERKDVIVKKSLLGLAGGAAFLITGGFFLSMEKFVSNPLLQPATSSFVFISIGFHVITIITMILVFDLNSLHSDRKINKLLLPLVLVGNILFTIFIVHSVVFIIPAKSAIVQALLPNEIAILLAGHLYGIFFVLVAIAWQKKDFKYSLEWMIKRMT